MVRARRQVLFPGLSASIPTISIPAIVRHGSQLTSAGLASGRIVTSSTARPGRGGNKITRLGPKVVGKSSRFGAKWPNCYHLNRRTPRTGRQVTSMAVGTGNLATTFWAEVAGFSPLSGEGARVATKSSGHMQAESRQSGQETARTAACGGRKTATLARELVRS